MATYSSTPAGITPWTEEPGRLPWGHKESDVAEHPLNPSEFTLGYQYGLNRD